MTQFEVKPTIQICDTCAELAQALELGPKDLILTNQYIYDPYFGPLNLSCPTIFQEKYGAGEPSDEWSPPSTTTCPRTSPGSSP